MQAVHFFFQNDLSHREEILICKKKSEALEMLMKDKVLRVKTNKHKLIVTQLYFFFLAYSCQSCHKLSAEHPLSRN